MSSLSLRRAAASLIVIAAAIGFGSLSASASAADEFEEFGFESVAAELSTTLAGEHPDLTTEFVLNHHENEEGRQVSSARPENISVALPPGLTGNPNVVPRCQTGEFLGLTNCPVDSQAGLVRFLATNFSETTEPLFNLEPPHRKDAVARLGFFAFLYPVYIDISVRTGSDYGLTATIHDATGQAPLISARTTLWGVPADPIHDTQRLTTIEAAFACTNGTACLAPEGKRASSLAPKPFLTNPSACQNQEVKYAASSYQLPGKLFGASVLLPPTTDCAGLIFTPSLDLQPSSHRAGAPTGVHAVLHIPQQELVGTRAVSATRAAAVTLPPGMTLNPGVAAGLEACSAGQVGLGQETPSDCPNSSQLGTATIVSPALPEPIQGTIYQRTPEPGQLFRIWLVTNEFGLHLKLPGEVRPDPNTGQVSVEFAETPQLPVEEIVLDFKDGPRAPVKNPDRCATYQTGYRLTPWSGGPATAGQSSTAITEGCRPPGFAPTFEAGVTNPVAGGYSPFVMNLRREDGEENVAAITMTFPKGELAKLAGVPRCADSAAGSGNCPASSQIGGVTVAAGAGSQPLWVPQPGKAATAVYLGGPYKGAPYSVVFKVPAQAGPFDLGTVVVRGGIYVDPDTAQVTVKADPLPQILEGVPVLYRALNVSIDRAQFMLNPTNCEPMSAGASVTSSQGWVATVADRFQVGGCAGLQFKPKISLRLKGSTRRGKYPALAATLRTGQNEANIGKVSVALPHSEFLAQEHIRTICTRVEFSQDACPAGSVYGRARAVTPLLEQPLEGPVYLRSSSNELPDLVAALDGQLKINLVGRIDSFKGGIRTTFTDVMDAPVTEFVLEMKGGPKSLLTNSTDICDARRRATVVMTGQNGKVHDFRPLLQPKCRR